MAIPKRHDPDLDALLRRGAAEITRLNPISAHLLLPTQTRNAPLSCTMKKS